MEKNLRIKRGPKGEDIHSCTVCQGRGIVKDDCKARAETPFAPPPLDCPLPDWVEPEKSAVNFIQVGDLGPEPESTITWTTVASLDLDAAFPPGADDTFVRVGAKKYGEMLDHEEAQARANADLNLKIQKQAERIRELEAQLAEKVAEPDEWPEVEVQGLAHGKEQYIVLAKNRDAKHLTRAQADAVVRAYKWMVSQTFSPPTNGERWIKTEDATLILRGEE